MAAMLLLGGSIVTAAAPAPPKTFTIACAKNGDGKLQYVATAADCPPSRGKLVRFKQDYPVRACQLIKGNPGTSKAALPPPAHPHHVAGMLFRAPPGACHGPKYPNSKPVVLPQAKNLKLCAGKRRGTVRVVGDFARCNDREFRLLLPKLPAPDVANDSATSDEDHIRNVNVLANDPGPGPLSVASIDRTGLKGVVSKNGNGTLRWGPNGKFDSLKAGQTGQDVFRYRATNGSGTSDPAKVTMTVTGVNDAPKANNDTASTDKDTATTISVLANDTDPEGEALTVASVDTTGTQGSVTLNPNGTISYDPNGKFPSLGPNDTAHDTFKYKANDSHADSNSATVDVTVTGINHAPILSNIESGALAYDTGSGGKQITNSIQVSEPDGTTLKSATVKITSGHLPARDALAFTPQLGITGTYNSGTGVLTLTSGSGSSASDWETALRDVKYSATAPTPAGSRTISFQIDDGGSGNHLSNVVTRDITLTHVNHAPVAMADTATTSEEATKGISVLANDSDPDEDTPLHVASTDTTGTVGQVTLNPNNTFTYDPNGQFNNLKPGDTTTDSFKYRAADPSNEPSNEVTVEVTITGVNDAPVLSAIEGSALAYDTGSGAAQITNSIAAADVDNANLKSATVSITSGLNTPTDATPGADTLSFTPQFGISGSYNSGTGVLTLTTGTGGASKSDWETALRAVKYAASSPTPAGSRTISFQVDDGEAANHASNVVTRGINLTHVNHAPVASGDTATTSEDATKDVAVLANDTDEDADALHVSATDTTGTVGLVTINGDNTIKYDPNAQFDSLKPGDTAPDSFKYKAADTSNADSNEVTVSLTITGVNDAPVLSAIEPSPFTYDAGDPAAAITSTLQTADVDNANLKSATVSISSGLNTPTDATPGADALSLAAQPNINSSYDPTTGVLTLTTGAGGAPKSEWDTALRAVKFSATGPTPAGSRTISFQVDDGEAANHASNVATRNITVTNNNLPPTDISLSSTTIASDQPSGTTVGTLSTTDPDPSDTHTYSLVSGTGSDDNGSFTITGDTLKTASSLPTGTYKVRIRTDDGNGGTFEKAFTIDAIPDAIPTDIQLSNSSVDENQASGTTVGTLTTTDADAGDTHTYSLVSGTGDTDNGSFQITGDQLKTNASLDFEAGSTRSIRIKTDDGKGGTFEKQFTITIGNKNDAPTNIGLTSTSVAENQPSGTTVGSFSTTDQDSGDTHTYTLATGTGDDDNGSFQISGSTLQTNAIFDFETKSSYKIRVKTDDGNGGTFEKQFTISVTNANDAPTDLALSPSSVGENASLGTTVGNLSTTDQDSGDTHTYTLATGTGDDDNGSFTINGTAVQTNTLFDFETKSSYKIRVKTDDGNGGTFEKALTITITDQNDLPTDIGLTSTSVAENQPTGTTVGTLSTSDQDSGDTHTYTLATGTGDDDNGSFQISGTTLQTNATFDFETKSSYKIRVKTDDGNGGTFEKQFTISITNANEAPTDIALSPASIDENQPSGSNVGTFSTTDPDTGDTHTYTLVSGTGDTNNGSFTISSGTLKTAASFDFETKSSYSIRVRSTDNGSPNLNTEKVFTISVNDVNEPPVAGPDSYDGIGNTGLFVGNTKPAGESGKEMSGSFLTNDSDPDAGSPALVAEPTGVPQTTTLNGKVSIDSDGTFSYLPPVNQTGVSDTFTYRVCSASPCNASTPAADQATGTVTVPLAGQVWYVKNNATAGGDGTSDEPFDTLAEADTASGTGDTTFVYKGDGTATGYSTSYTMASTERLFGEVNGLTLDPDGGGPLGTENLHGGTANAYPLITSTTGDVVTLASGVQLRGFTIDPGSASGGGVFGTALGASTVTIANNSILDTGTSGAQPGLELTTSSTTTTNVSDLTVSTTGGATGVRVNGAGTTNFQGATSTISVTSAGGKALDASGPNQSMGTGSQFDDLTSTGSNAGGVGMVSTTGTTALGDASGTDLDLTTTSGTSPTLSLLNPGTVSVAGGGNSSLHATPAGAGTAGPVLDVQTAPNVTLDLDTVESKNSTTDGINWDGNSGSTFVAASGGTNGIVGAQGIAVDVNGGNGNFTYPGALGDGTGSTADITGRGGGTVALSGAISDSSDAGGGITIGGAGGLGNTAGTTTFSNAAKALSTTTGNGVVMDNNTGHTINFTNGGLTVTTTTGKGVEATGGGTLNITGTGNTIDTGAGRALNVSNTTVGAGSPLLFERISSNGSGGGIQLNSTGPNAALTVAGSGGVCTNAVTAGCTGGQITGATGADDTGSTPVGTGIVLNNTKSPSLTRMWIHDNSNYAIHGQTVDGFTMANSVINGTNGTTANDNSLFFDDNSSLTTVAGLTGSASITDSYIGGGAANQLWVSNSSGSLNRLTLDTVTLGSNSTTVGNDAVQVEGLGTSTTNVTVKDSTFTNARGDTYQQIAGGSGGGDLDFENNAVSNNHPAIANAGGGVTLSGGAQGGTFGINIHGTNTFRDARTNAITIIKSDGPGSMTGTIDNATIGVLGVDNSGSIAGSGIELTDGGHTGTTSSNTTTVSITNTTIREYNNFGISLVGGLGGGVRNGTFNVTATGNTITDPGNNANVDGFQGFALNNGTVPGSPGDTFQTCLHLKSNNLFGSGVDGSNDIRVRSRMNGTVRLPGYGGSSTDDTAVATFLANQNDLLPNNPAANPPVPTSSAAHDVTSGGFIGTGTTCP